MRNRKIAFVTHSLVRGGSPIFLLEFVRAGRTETGPLLVVSEQDGPLRADFEALGVPVMIEPRGGPLELGLVWRLIRLLRREHVALVHLNTFTSYYKYAAMAARWLRLPVVWGIREDVRARRCQKLFPWIKSLATAIVPCSHEIARNLYPGGPPPKLTVVHDGLPVSAPPASAPNIRALLKIPPPAKIIGCVAALEPRKGIKELIEAFARLRGSGLEAHLVCVGEDRSAGHTYQPLLEALIRERGLDGCVHLTGGRADVPGWYPQFDLFVLPTWWEGISRVLLEAAHAGVPIVTTLAGGNGELIENHRGGLLVEPGNVNALAGAMEKLLGDPAMAAGFTAHTRKVLEKSFTLEQYAARMRMIYQDLLPPQA